MIYQMSLKQYNSLRKTVKIRDRESTMDTEVKRSFLAGHPKMSPHGFIIWYVNQQLGLPEGTITEVRTYGDDEGEVN